MWDTPYETKRSIRRKLSDAIEAHGVKMLIFGYVALFVTVGYIFIVHGPK